MKHLLSFCLIPALCLLPIPEKQYSVSHTVPDWQKTIEGEIEVNRIIHKSKLPADEAFYCDSVLNSHLMDISRQVNAGMVADTSKTKKP
jgi:hypothetical protein